MERFLKTGFVLSASADSLKRKDIIKVQHNCKATGFWAKKSKAYNFLLIMHEHLFVFIKLASGKVVSGEDGQQIQERAHALDFLRQAV